MRKQFLLALITISIYSCGTQPEKSSAAKTDNPNKEIALKVFEAFNKHDWNAHADFYAPDAEYLDPSYGTEPVKKTHQELVEKYAGLQKAIPDINDNITGIYDAGGNIIVEFVAKGTLPDGKKFSLPLCTVFTIRDKKVIRDATYYDNDK